MDDLVAKALHAARQHFDEGGFLDSLRGMFSGPDYMSNGKEASFANMPTQDETNADFFKADRALRLAQQAQAPETPLTAPRPGAVETRELPARQPIASPPPAPTQIPFAAPDRGVTMSGSGPATLASQPLAYTAAPAPAPAQAAITAAMPVGAKFENRIDPNAIDERAENVWSRMLRQESGNRQFDRYGNTITSPAGALGISQVMPSTGPEAARLAGLPWSLERLRNDPEYNHALGRAYYDAQVERFGDPTLAAAAYNGGPGRVASALRQARETGQPWTAFLKPETQHYVRVVGRAEGGEVDDALHVVREHHADGEAVGMNQRMRDTIASIDPERSQDQPVMDPATMGEAWNRARQNYQNFPVQEGEAVARQFVPSVRQEIGAAIAGEGAGRDYGSELRNRAAQFAVGSSGLDTGMGALDFVPGTSQALGATDIAHDIGQGDYTGAAEGAALPVAMTAAQKFAGPIGRGLSYAGEKIAEHARPIAGVAGTAAALSPDDAEAANALKIVRKIGIGHNGPPGFIVTGNQLIAKDPAISNIVLSKRDLSGNAKQGMRAKDVEYDITPKGDLQPWKKFNPEDIYNSNGYVTSALGDRSRAGALLNSINGVQFENPINLQGGGEFKRSLEDPAIWASRESAVKGMRTGLNKAIKAQNIPEDAPIYMSHTIMGYPSLDSTQMMAQAILRQINPTISKISPDSANAFDTYVRRFHPDWPGILNPEDAERYLKTNEAGTRTSGILQALDKATEQKGGLPNLGAARLAVMEPRLMSADQLSSGFAISKLDPSMRGNTVAHETYTTPMYGEYMGGTEHQIPAHLMFPDWYNKMSPTFLEKKTGLIKPTTPTMYQQGLLTQVPVQKATQEWLDNIMSHIEKHGKKWGYRYGGEA